MYGVLAPSTCIMSTKMKRQRGERKDGVQTCCLRTINRQGSAILVGRIWAKSAGKRLEIQRKNGERKIEARMVVVPEGLWLLRADGAGDLCSASDILSSKWCVGGWIVPIRLIP